MIYVGTAGWSYPSGKGRWNGVFYPKKLPDAEKLSYYAQFFRAVEINSSFYGPPSARVTATWAERVPADFRFTAKLWQKFTHSKMFEEATGQPALVHPDDFALFTEGLQPLVDAHRLGPVLAQFPPSFKPDPGNLEYLEDLIRRLEDNGYRLTVELRHRDWTRPPTLADLRALFEEHGVAWTMIDEPRFRTSISDVPLTSSVGYFRFHGRNYQQWWHHDAGEERYNYAYSPAEQADLAADVRAVAEQTQDTYVFYNNHYGAKAVVNALALQLQFGFEAPQAPLPESLTVAFPDLAALLTQ